jgi:hypothetical protein
MDESPFGNFILSLILAALDILQFEIRRTFVTNENG